VPFCRHHCGYCDFAVVAGQDGRAESYLDALARELAGLDSPRPVDTLFIGGGTPTHLPVPLLERLLGLLRQWLPLAPGGEWSIESTPDSLSDDTVATLKAGGITRVSIGVQSFQDRLLVALDRQHHAADIAPAVERVRAAIPNVSLDLIFGVPGQSPADWVGDLSRAIALEPMHLSCYGLTYEPGTPLTKERNAGQVTPVMDEAEREMFVTADRVLGAAGYEHYEVSNYALAGHQCRHNATYWANESYFGFGLGAARYLDGRRESNTRRLDEYIARLTAGRSAIVQSEQLDAADRARETMSVQLRRAVGIAKDEFAARTGQDFDAMFGPAVTELVGLGLMTDEAGRVRFTLDGWCVADTVLENLWAASLPDGPTVPTG
jgi:oxygen-independent coproporphyrinogen-3 oxidase